MYKLLFFQSIQSSNEEMHTSESIQSTAEIQQPPTVSRDITNDGIFNLIFKKVYCTLIIGVSRYKKILKFNFIYSQIVK